MLLENKAESTIRQYTWYVKWFLTVNEEKEINKNAGELVKDFLQKQVLESGYGRTSQNQVYRLYKTIIVLFTILTYTPKPYHVQNTNNRFRRYCRKMNL